MSDVSVDEDRRPRPGKYKGRHHLKRAAGESPTRLGVPLDLERARALKQLVDDGPTKRIVYPTASPSEALLMPLPTRADEAVETVPVHPAMRLLGQCLQALRGFGRRP